MYAYEPLVAMPSQTVPGATSVVEVRIGVVGFCTLMSHNLLPPHATRYCVPPIEVRTSASTTSPRITLLILTGVEGVEKLAICTLFPSP